MTEWPYVERVLSGIVLQSFWPPELVAPGVSLWGWVCPPVVVAAIPPPFIGVDHLWLTMRAGCDYSRQVVNPTDGIVALAELWCQPRLLFGCTTCGTG